ncbi:aminotransferase class I/II-fold pyridoxal phosphate-dependent enzyme [Catenulispora pinisilvae]|uniref:aminotransferase class I/II-fold pyridoxal phosphate-dependent enzyme n=1 Tax=Catenulispora pinisilvae TaxID=2705253 RepID=UPI0018926E9C|nr:aminotransferase class I/II-fold pyridoxal phosphate-dependent enzyme [Catenulispora pinisilvae]
MLATGELHASLRDPVLDAMNLLNEVTLRYPESISFAPGRPYEGWSEVSEIARYLDVYVEYLREELGYDAQQIRTNLFQYGRTSGHINALVSRTILNDEKIHASAESIVLTVGAQEAMLLVLRALFAAQTDVLLVGAPSYVGITGAARLLDIEVLSVPETEDGLRPEAVREAAVLLRAQGKRARACYVVPDFANPSGRSMPAADRAQLLRVAEEQDLYILEDNPYGLFALDGEPRATLKSLDQDRRVLYLGSFAKTCFPGARVGYVVADQLVTDTDGTRRPLAGELAKIKSMVTVNTPALSQAVIGGMLLAADCRLREANRAAISFYRDNLTVLLSELARQFPPERATELGVSWNRPDGGFFVALTVPFPADEAALDRCAQHNKVIWTPMNQFYPDGGGEYQLRLSCSYLEPAKIVEGVRRLAAFITERISNPDTRNRGDEVSKTYDAVVDVLSVRFNIAPETVTPAATFDDLALDSLTLLELVDALADALGVEITDDELAEMLGLPDIVAKLEEKGLPA